MSSSILHCPLFKRCSQLLGCCKSYVAFVFPNMIKINQSTIYSPSFSTTCLHLVNSPISPSREKLSGLESKNALTSLSRDMLLRISSPRDDVASTWKDGNLMGRCRESKVGEEEPPILTLKFSKLSPPQCVAAHCHEGKLFSFRWAEFGQFVSKLHLLCPIAESKSPSLSWCSLGEIQSGQHLSCSTRHLVRLFLFQAQVLLLERLVHLGEPTVPFVWGYHNESTFRLQWSDSQITIRLQTVTRGKSMWLSSQFCFFLRAHVVSIHWASRPFPEPPDAVLLSSYRHQFPQQALLCFVSDHHELMSTIFLIKTWWSPWALFKVNYP